MLTTKHMAKRMNQRGITGRMVRTVLDYGINHNDTVSLGRKQAQQLISDFQDVIKILNKISDKGGVSVVIKDDACVTTWNLN